MYGRIEADGVPVGKLRRGGVATVAVAPGQHRVQAAIDWSGGPEIDVGVAPGHTVRVIVEPRGDPREVSQAVSSKGWLSLRIESTDEVAVPPVMRASPEARSGGEPRRPDPRSCPRRLGNRVWPRESGDHTIISQGAGSPSRQHPRERVLAKRAPRGVAVVLLQFPGA